MFFSKQLENGTQLENTKIKISVFDHNTVIKDSLIGVYEIDAI